MKRFWTMVTVEDRGILLDGREVRTPGRAALTVPTDPLAEAIAEEWRAVGDMLDPRTMRLTGLANAAIDRIAADPTTFAGSLAAYGASDLLCYRADPDDPLGQRQAERWDPILAWASARYDVRFDLATGVMPIAQPDATIERLGRVVAAYDPWHLAGLSPVVTTGGSLILALALAEGAVDEQTAWAAAQLDEDWQAERWGRDSLAEQARANRHADFAAAARFLALIDRSA